MALVPSVPNIIPVPFGHGAQRTVIPVLNPEENSPQSSWTSGFPPITMLNKQAGGKPPLGQDFNNILYELSSHAYFGQSGCVYPWQGSDAPTDFAGLNYIHGSHVLGSDGNEYVALKASGPDIPDTTTGQPVGPIDPVTDTNGYWMNLSAALSKEDLVWLGYGENKNFYIDPVNGVDGNPATQEAPAKTWEGLLEVTTKYVAITNNSVINIYFAPGDYERISISANTVIGSPILNLIGSKDSTGYPLTNFNTSYLVNRGLYTCFHSDCPYVSLNGIKINFLNIGNMSGAGITGIEHKYFLNCAFVCDRTDLVMFGQNEFYYIDRCFFDGKFPYCINSSYSYISIYGENKIGSKLSTDFTAFCEASYNGIIYAPYATFVGTCTGIKYQGILNGVIFVGGRGPNVFPGTSAGFTTTGAIYE